MLGSDRRADHLTPDLLSAWTDPDTAMELVGTSLGIFGWVPRRRSVLAGESPLRTSLHDVLLGLVNVGALEKRACSDGRFAFRWPADRVPGASSAGTDAARLESSLATLRAGSRPRPRPAEPVVVPAPKPQATGWPRLLAPAAPLALPAVSCLLAILAFVSLNHFVALAIAVALTAVGIVGLVRRVPFAGLWTVGLILAGLLLRLS